jgi:hypothetical protein
MIDDLSPLDTTPDDPELVEGSERTRWMIVMSFAIAMAWVEAASVFYIRALVDRIEPYQADPLPIHGSLGNVELWREAATLVMIATVGMLAGRTWQRRAGYAALAFGAWDIFYYVFLRLISGWPRTLLDWDILFLLPLPWWGPVLAPVSIALVMILWGTLATQARDRATNLRWTLLTAALGWAGIVLALAVFMIDAWRALPAGRDAVLHVLPTTFSWRLFSVAWMLMALPVLAQCLDAFRLASSGGVKDLWSGCGGRGQSHDAAIATPSTSAIPNNDAPIGN